VLVALVAAVSLIAGLQSAAPARLRAAQLARDGKTAEAMALFERIVQATPDDVEAQLWMGRLEMRLGRNAAAEERFRTVLKDHPADVDAKILLGAVLTRRGDWRQALTVLTAAEADAGENPDLFDALGRAYRRGGDDRRALDYFGRAKRLAPDNPELPLAYEAVARNYGHQFIVEGFSASEPSGGRSDSGMLAGSFRVSPRVHLGAATRLQNGPGYSDVQAGGDVLWLTPGATTVTIQALGGSGNARLGTGDVSGQVVKYSGMFEFGGGVRWLQYTDVKVLTASPVFAWYANDAWRLDARYTYSHSSFETSGRSSGDHSVLLRETWQAKGRVALIGSYAYGIESFENLTADRLGSLGGSTAAAGVRFDLRSLSRITTMWEHQWRSNDAAIDRVTVSLQQSIP
jgi:tetratricopeptide (TPR) repeat protein